jgi:hypothetical protein
MKRWASWVFTLVALFISTVAISAQTKSGLDKLYILNCGEGVAGDISGRQCRQVDGFRR